MAESFVVRSTEEGARLELARVDDERFTVHLEHTGISATVVAFSFRTEGLASFFASIARDWRGWDGERRWASFENEVELSATADRAGHVRLVVDVNRGWPPNGWHARGTLLLEAGQLDSLAREAVAFEAAALRST